MSKLTPQEIEKQKRAALFVPCSSMKHLHTWIKAYLGVDLPDSIICDDDTTHDPSNSSPMHFLWEIYQKALDGRDPDYQQVLTYSSRDGGKCVEKGTLLLTRQGFMPIENVKIGDEIWSGFSWKKVTDWIHDGEKEAVGLTLSNGLQLTVSPIHRVWAWEPGKKPDWKRVSELTEQDLVCVDTSSGFGSSSIVQEEYDIGYLCGLLQGDGCLTLMDVERYGQTFYQVTLTTADDYVLNFWKSACLKYAGKLPTQSKSRPYDWTIYSKSFVEILKSWGLKSSYSWEKEYPEICLKSKSYAAGFISGLIDTDGTINKTKNDIVLSMTCEKLLKKTQVVLHGLGVNCLFRSNSKIRGLQKHLVHHLVIGQNDLAALLAAGIRVSAKKANELNLNALNVNVHDSFPRTHVQPLISLLDIPGGKFAKRIGTKPVLHSYPSTSRAKLKLLVEWGYNNQFLTDEEADHWNQAFQNKWVSVKEIRRDFTADFFDLTVDDDHSYWSNGLISHNTLCAAIFEVLCLLHLNRNVCHLAAIEQQAKKCQEYVEKFFRRPILREYITSKNKRTIEVTKFVHYDNKDDIISPEEFKVAPKSEQDNYIPKTISIKILVCTLNSVNGEHPEILVLDELDLAPRKPVEEAKMTASLGENGELPIIYSTSTRKSSFGPVQDDLDRAQETGLIVRHWNIIDVTQKCPTDRHLPKEPRIPIYYNEDKLKAINEREYLTLPEAEKKFWQREMGFTGCLKNCSMFAMCKGRLATKQKSTSAFLKPVVHTQTMFRKVSLETAKAQLLCWKPSNEGLIFPNYDPGTHLIPANKMAEKITGDEYPESFSKLDLIDLFKEYGAEFYSGMDHGYTHDFAVVTAALLGHTLYVIDVYSQSQLELEQKVDICKERILNVYGSVIYPDEAYPADNQTFRRNGFKMVKFTKDVFKSIEAARKRLRPGSGLPPAIFFLKGDDGVERLCKDLQKYHWQVDLAGKFTEKPEKEDDDRVDAFRYLCQNVPLDKGSPYVPKDQDLPLYNDNPNKQLMKNKLRELMGEEAEVGGTVVGKPGGLRFII